MPIKDAVASHPRSLRDNPLPAHLTAPTAPLGHPGVPLSARNIDSRIRWFFDNGGEERKSRP